MAETEVYQLKGRDIEITYRRDESQLVTKGEPDYLVHDSLEGATTVVPDNGIAVTATVASMQTRAGERPSVNLILLLPEMDGKVSGDEGTEVQGVAVIVDVSDQVDSYEARDLKGTVKLEG